MWYLVRGAASVTLSEPVFHDHYLRLITAPEVCAGGLDRGANTGSRRRVALVTLRPRDGDLMIVAGTLTRPCAPGNGCSRQETGRSAGHSGA